MLLLSDDVETSSVVVVVVYGGVASVGVSMDEEEDDSTPTNRAINSFLFPCVDHCRAANCAFNWSGFSVLMSFEVRDGSI